MKVTTLTKKSLVLKYEVFNFEEDKNIPTSQKFSNIRTTASDEALKNVGEKLAILINSTGVFIRKEENYIFD
ncbi:DUF1659 domain-containing protein [Clostridium massiliamazoniense]|uniref:DUF1659 domain-containing protein n=1 Tax=Clostridium massiliamazoniense TaxID=1347366 RepID=UPI0006D76CB3|nr:DUF1659 domain-containing protein [Clostridium massiliamazoniense]